MANKTQKRAQQAKRKEEKRRRERVREKKRQSNLQENRLEKRLAKQSPEAWQGELPADVAIFDDHVLQTLDAESLEQAKTVRDAIAEVCARLPGEAVQRLAEIPRRSPFADWRLFVRGLIAWQNHDLAAAKTAWDRLESERRPWRIAASLVLAHREDLTELKLAGLQQDPSDSDSTTASADGGAPREAWLAKSDLPILNHAKLVRQSQVERVSLRAAKGITRIRSEVRDATVDPEHIQWLRGFTKQYSSLDPNLVQALHEATVLRAFHGPYIDIFYECVQHFRGPKFDRKHYLLRYHFEKSGPRAKEAAKILQQYLESDLPNNAELLPAFRGALASQIYCVLATESLNPSEDSMSPFDFFRRPKPSHQTAEKYYDRAITAYPTHRAAYESYESIYLDLLEDEDWLKAKREEFESKLASIRTRRLKHLPDDIETRLELVDYLLSHDRSSEAEVHVQWLAGTRTENPLAAAMQWKWNLLEAMRMAKRKNTVKQAMAHLDAAEKIWPSWLAMDWLPYLKAAVNLRAGDASAFDTMSANDRSTSSVAHASMKMGAAQKMSVPATVIQSLRAEIDALLKKRGSLAVPDLIEAAAFYWDLNRTRLRYPALRMHGTKFLSEIRDRLEEEPEVVSEHWDDEKIRSVLLEMVNQGLFNDRYELHLPEVVTEGDDEKKTVARAVSATAHLRLNVPWKRFDFRELIEDLRQASQTESDAFYRYHYSSLAQQLERRQDQKTSGLSPFAAVLERLMGRVDETDNDDDEGAPCNCAECRRERGEL